MPASVSHGGTSLRLLLLYHTSTGTVTTGPLAVALAPGLSLCPPGTCTVQVTLLYHTDDISTSAFGCQYNFWIISKEMNWRLGFAFVPKAHWHDIDSTETGGHGAVGPIYTKVHLSTGQHSQME